jgi:hypothetical protein
MGQKVFQNALNLSFIPAISPFDAYADGDAFGAVIDLSSQIDVYRGGNDDTFGNKFFEVATVHIADYDNQQATFNLFFKGEDFAVDIADNDPFDPAGSDRVGLLGPFKVEDTAYSEYPVGAGVWASGATLLGARIPLVGKKLLVKAVIRKASTFSSVDAVAFRLVGHVN